MKILGIIHIRDGCAKLYSCDALTVNEVNTSFITTGPVYLYLKGDDFTCAVDYCKMFNAVQGINVCSDWEALVDILDNLESNGYDLSNYVNNNIPVPSYMIIDDRVRDLSFIKHGLSLIGDHQLNIIAANVDTFITIGHGSVTKPNYNDRYHFRRSTPDATFSCKKGNYINFNNTIPVCNGYFCYPHVVNSVLYGEEGARLCRNLTDRNAGHILIDFTPAGSIECVKLKECSGTISKFNLPSGYTMSGKSVLLVLDGRLFLPHEFRRLSSRTISFEKSRFTPYMRADKKQCLYDFEPNTTIIKDDGEFDLMKCENSFLILIDAKITIGYHEPIMRISDNSFKFPGYVGGLAYDLSSKTILDYTRIQYGGGHFIQNFDEFDPQKYIASSFKEFVKDRYSVINVNRQNWAKPLESGHNYMCNSITYSSRRNLDVFNQSVEHGVILLDFMF